jgi:hypothetical protein
MSSPDEELMEKMLHIHQEKGGSTPSNDDSATQRRAAKR